MWVKLTSEWISNKKRNYLFAQLLLNTTRSNIFVYNVSTNYNKYVFLNFAHILPQVQLLGIFPDAYLQREKRLNAENNNFTS